jgi:hypothetical protein
MPLTIDVRVNISQSVAIGGEDKVFAMAEKRFSQYDIPRIVIVSVNKNIRVFMTSRIFSLRK